VLFTNDPPDFTKGADQTVAANSGTHIVRHWATSIPAGPNEADQQFTFLVSADNVGLFAAQPAVTPAGTLTYTLAPNAFGTATVTLWLEDNGGTAVGGVDVSPPQTFTITVNPVADAPSVTNATTNEDTQTISGLVVSRNAVDGSEVTYFKITGITNGTLFQNDGATPISNGDFITFAQGNVGLKFTPDANFFGTGSFDVRASLSSTGAGLPE
jgi:hypothetical protein